MYKIYVAASLSLKYFEASCNSYRCIYMINYYFQIDFNLYLCTRFKYEFDSLNMWSNTFYQILEGSWKGVKFVFETCALVNIKVNMKEKLDRVNVP
jgi:hypothetical protein